jgi:hypothetical protein
MTDTDATGLPRREPWSLPKSQRRILLAALTLGTLAKVFLAFKASATLDSIAYVEFLNEIREKGGIALYQFRGSFNNPFIFPPAIIHLIKALGFISDSTGLPFKFWLRLLPSLADVGSFFVIWRLLRGHKDLFRLLFLLALCPTSIVINGYEGNVDGFMIFPVLLAVWLIESQKPLWLGGAAWGMALNVKAVPLMFVAALFFRLRSTRARIQFFAVTAAVILICSMPFIFQSPGIIKEVFGYASIYGVWGITKLAVIIAGPPVFLYWPYDPTGWHSIFASGLKFVAFAVIVIVSYEMNRNEPKSNLLKQCGLIVAIFLFLTPGFGVQYLVWLVPFVTAAGLRATAIYYFTTTVYLAFASQVLACHDFGCSALMFLCWLSIGVVIFEFCRSIRSNAEDAVISTANLQ